MKRLLLVGGSYADIPIIQAAKKLDLYVITSGNNPNDMGHKYADETHLRDYSNPQEICTLAKDLDIDYICPSANDFSALSCAYTAQKLSLPGYDSYEISQLIHHKDKFRRFALQNDICAPKAISLQYTQRADLISLDLSYPLLVKPTDLSGGKGITKVTQKDQLDTAIERAQQQSKADEVVIEEFLEGSNHGYSTIIKDQKVVFGFMDDEHYYKNPYLVSGASTSLHYSKELKQKLDEEIFKITQKLQLVDGLLHVQFILRDNRPYILEICRRTPGDLYVKLVSHAMGLDYPLYILQGFCDLGVQVLPNDFKMNYVTRHCIMSEINGTVQKISYKQVIEQNIIERFDLYKDQNEISNFMTYKAGIVFLHYDSKQEMLEKTKHLTELIQIKMENVD